MQAGVTSLLRLFSTASGRLVLLPLALLALAAPAAAAGPAPDPSPSAGAVRPDPYLESRTQQAPTHVVVPRAAVRTPAPAAPVHKTLSVPPKHKARARTAAVAPARTVMRLRRPDGAAPTIAERLVSAVDPARHISTGLALAVAGLVLLSGALVAGVTREVAR